MAGLLESDYTPYGLIKRMLPKQDYGQSRKITTTTPLFNFNNSGFQVPTINASEFTPTLGMGATKPIVKSTPIVTTPKGLVGTTPKSKIKTVTKSNSTNNGMRNPPPALVPATSTIVQDVPTGVPSGMGEVSARMPYEVSNKDIFVDTNNYLDNRGMTGEVALPEGQYTNLAGDGTVGLVGTPASSNWVDGLSNFETLQGAAGLGGLAMNAYGMFGSGGTMDVNKKNIELMNQQLANNRDVMATRTARAKDISSAFGGNRTGLGV